MKTTTPIVTLSLTAEEVEDLTHALSIAIDALTYSDRHAAVCALVGEDECKAFIAKIKEAVSL